MQNRRTVAAALGAAAVAASVAGTAVAASAAPSAPSARTITVPCTVGYPPVSTQCSVTVALTVGPNGQLHLSFTFAAIGSPGETFTIYVFSTAATLGTFTADAQGNLTGAVDLPALGSGSHTLQAVGATGGSASTTFTVPSSAAAAPAGAGSATGTGAAGGTGSASGTGSSSLPFTGADVAAISVVGGALLLGGGVAYAAGARRRRATPLA